MNISIVFLLPATLFPETAEKSKGMSQKKDKEEKRKNKTVHRGHEGRGRIGISLLF